MEEGKWRGNENEIRDSELYDMNDDVLSSFELSFRVTLCSILMNFVQKLWGFLEIWFDVIEIFFNTQYTRSPTMATEHVLNVKTKTRETIYVHDMFWGWNFNVLNC